MDDVLEDLDELTAEEELEDCDELAADDELGSSDEDGVGHSVTDSVIVEAGAAGIVKVDRTVVVYSVAVEVTIGGGVDTSDSTTVVE